MDRLAQQQGPRAKLARELANQQLRQRAAAIAGVTPASLSSRQARRILTAAGKLPRPAPKRRTPTAR